MTTDRPDHRIIDSILVSPDDVPDGVAKQLIIALATHLIRTGGRPMVQLEAVLKNAAANFKLEVYEVKDRNFKAPQYMFRAVPKGRAPKKDE